MDILIIAACWLLFVWKLQRNFQQGVAFSVFLFVIAPHHLALRIPGLPDFTLQRLVLLTMLPFLPKALRGAPPVRSVPFIGGLTVLAVLQTCSTICSIAFVDSLKMFLSFTFEVMMFYIVVTLSIRDTDDRDRIIRSAVGGLTVVAVFAAIEKYNGFRIFDLFGSFGQMSDGFGVTSTYSHRIMLGYAMAMAAPLVLFMLKNPIVPRDRIKAWAILLLVIAACYFSASRGPWLGLALGCAALVALTGKALLRPAIIVAVLAAAVLILRPGVRQTIWGLSSSTFQEDTLKGKSYEYRWKLWSVAWSEITSSPVRLLFGFGGQSTETMDLSRYFEKESGGTTAILGYTSWDNNWASNLIEYGILGFVVQLLVFLRIVKSLLRSWRQSNDQDRFILGTALASMGIYLFAMTNVYIFSPQLTYLFWAMVAVGSATARLAESEETVTAEFVDDHPHDSKAAEAFAI